MTRVAIADDHPIVRQGLRRIASEGAKIAVTGEAATAAELFRLVRGTPVDVVLLDVSMPGSTFVETVRELREKHPTVRVLVLSVHPEDQWAMRAAPGPLAPDRITRAAGRGHHRSRAAESTSAKRSPRNSRGWWTSARPGRRTNN
jgi:CheY-like chemotaxis protein